MADQSKGERAKGYRSQRDAEGGEKSGFDRALEPDGLSEGVTCLVGLVGPSTREGYRVLFLSTDMNSRVEIRDEDIVYSEKLSPEESPFGSLGGTRVCVKKGTKLDYSRTTAKQVQAEALAGDEFDLDIRLGKRGGIGPGAQEALIPPPITSPPTICECTEDTCFRTLCNTCVTCDTCLRTICETCPRTNCGPTCLTCDVTCDTCLRTICETCPRTNCGPTCLTCDVTCDTCLRTICATCQRTNCGPTCLTCLTCDTCRGPQCITGLVC